MCDEYELLYLAGENNEYAIKELLKKYYNFLYSKAVKNCKIWNNFDDYMNEMILGFYNAIDNYNGDSKFITYLNACLDYKAHNYSILSNRKKHSILNNAISIEEITNISSDEDKYNPEKILLEEQDYLTLKRKIKRKLTSQEELVFSLKEQGFSIKEISKILDKKVQTVYKYYENIKRKAGKLKYVN